MYTIVKTNLDLSNYQVKEPNRFYRGLAKKVIRPFWVEDHTLTVWVLPLGAEDLVKHTFQLPVTDTLVIRVDEEDMADCQELFHQIYMKLSASYKEVYIHI